MAEINAHAISEWTLLGYTSPELNYYVDYNNNVRRLDTGAIVARNITNVKDAEKLEGKSVFYSVRRKDQFKNKKISIFGGGDSALDWALELSKNSKVTLVHRRDEFRGAPHTLNEIKKKEKEGKIIVKTKYQLSNIEGNEKTRRCDRDESGQRSHVERSARTYTSARSC